jgi:hypothetical protein
VVFNPIDLNPPYPSLLLSAEKPIINVDDLGAVTGTLPTPRPVVFDTSIGKIKFDDLGGSCTVLASMASKAEWVVASDPTCDIARLVRLTRTKGQAIETQLGLYHLPFEVTVMYR